MTPLTKRLAIALAVSLGLNLLLGGIFVGFALQRLGQRGPRHEGPPHGEMAPRSAKHGEEPRFRRGALRRAFHERHPELKGRKEATVAARRAVAKALENEPFDKSALETALGDLRKQTLESQELVHRALVENATSAEAAARKEMAAEFVGPRRR